MLLGLSAGGCGGGGGSCATVGLATGGIGGGSGNPGSFSCSFSTCLCIFSIKCRLARIQQG